MFNDVVILYSCQHRYRYQSKFTMFPLIVCIMVAVYSRVDGAHGQKRHTCGGGHCETEPKEDSAVSIVNSTHCLITRCVWNNPCLNGGRCVQKHDCTFLCDCIPGYTGRVCETLITTPNAGSTPSVSTPPTPVDCGGGFQCVYGECSYHDNAVKCICDKQHIGTFCNIPCYRDCGERGTCDRINSTAPEVCLCQYPYVGEFCDQVVRLGQVIQVTTAKRECKSGWMKFDDKQCILAIEDKKSFADAGGSCRRKGGQLVTILSPRKQTFLRENTMRHGNNYWIGLHRDYGSYESFNWKINGRSKPTGYENWSSEDSLGARGYYERCVYISSSDGKWYSTTTCSEQRRYICEASAQCTEGRFGTACDMFCHCHGTTCDPISGHCKYGCQRGWYGTKCDEKKVPAVVTFHCFNTTSQGAYMLLRVDPRGVKYAAIDGLGQDKLPLHSCGIETFHLDDDTGVYDKKVLIRDNEDTLCGGKMLSESEYEWTFSLKENTGVMSENDAVVNVKCDFTNADQLMTEGIQEIKGKVETKLEKLEETVEEVKLSVVDAFTNQDVKDVELGASVKLRLQLLTPGSSVDGLSGYSCEAFTSDHSFTKALTDEHGCSVDGSPVSPMKQENTSAVSGFFSMFTFPGFSQVNFRCRYEYCFKPEIRCQNRCAYRRMRGKRSAESKETAVRKPVYTTVRVLARDQENESVDPPGDGHHGVPLLYLNPITCSMFLFLLTVFLLYYVFFIKSLKRSVEEMKSELRHHNRRGFSDL